MKRMVSTIIWEGDRDGWQVQGFPVLKEGPLEGLITFNAVDLDNDPMQLVIRKDQLIAVETFDEEIEEGDGDAS